MQDFVFSNKTKIYFGKDQLHHLGEEVSRFGKKVLLVYGGGSIKKIGLYDKVIAELNKAGTEVFELPELNRILATRPSIRARQSVRRKISTYCLR